MKEIAIIGAGGHTRSSLNLIKQYFNDFHIAIYDDSYCVENEKHVLGIKIIGKISDIKCENIFLSLGDNKKREEYFIKFSNQIIINNLIHKKSFLESGVILGIANQVYANTYINSEVRIENNNIINSGSIIEHETNIGSHNHISIGAKIAGRVSIGDGCFIGAGAIIVDKINIGNYVTIGAGSVVIHDIIETGIYAGVPARKIR